MDGDGQEGNAADSQECNQQKLETRESHDLLPSPMDSRASRLFRSRFSSTSPSAHLINALTTYVRE